MNRLPKLLHFCQTPCRVAPANVYTQTHTQHAHAHTQTFKHTHAHIISFTIVCADLLGIVVNSGNSDTLHTSPHFLDTSRDMFYTFEILTPYIPGTHWRIWLYTYEFWHHTYLICMGNCHTHTHTQTQTHTHTHTHTHIHLLTQTLHSSRLHRWHTPQKMISPYIPN